MNLDLVVPYLKKTPKDLPEYDIWADPLKSTS